MHCNYERRPSDRQFGPWLFFETHPFEVDRWPLLRLARIARPRTLDGWEQKRRKLTLAAIPIVIHPTAYFDAIAAWPAQ
jgi:hypothetical protein